MRINKNNRIPYINTMALQRIEETHLNQKPDPNEPYVSYNLVLPEN